MCPFLAIYILKWKSIVTWILKALTCSISECWMFFLTICFSIYDFIFEMISYTYFRFYSIKNYNIAHFSVNNMSFEILIAGWMEFDEVWRKDRKKKIIPIAYFMVHSNKRPFVARNEMTYNLIHTVITMYWFC